MSKTKLLRYANKSRFDLRLLLCLMLMLVSIVGAAQSRLDCPYCNLSGNNYAGQDLTNANFSGAILDNANFSNCILNGAMFANASLIHANFSGAKLDPSSFGPADLSGANLSYANFTGASLTGMEHMYSTITGVNFTNANLMGSLPGLYLILHNISKEDRPIFTNTTLPCEYKRFSGILDLSKAKFSKCDNLIFSTPSGTTQIVSQEIPSDPTAPTRVLVITTSEEKPTNKNKKTKQNSEKNQLASSAASNTIFVSTSGTDMTGCGTLLSPCKTINHAVAICAENGTIAVDYGQYPVENTILLQKNITLIGGYDGGQPTKYQSQIAAPADGTPVFNVSGNGVKVNLSNFIMNGSVPTTLNHSSTVVTAGNNATMEMNNVNINAAKGGQGGPGTTGTTGSIGGDGKAGSGGVGGGGGTSACSNNSGGAGANQSTKASANCKCSFACLTCTSESSMYEYKGGSGLPGTTPSLTSGGAPGSGINYLCPDTKRPPSGSNGANGASAGCGNSGNPSSNIAGTFQNGVWVPVLGGTGGQGGVGAGGGGGGSGGSCHYCDCFCSGTGSFYNGTAGGGGGAGGCGASGGTGGAQGGASFGIVLQSATCVLNNTVKITSGAGGDGGKGGSGNSGGKGGGSGAAQPSKDVCNNTGAQGGAGGSGGAGGASGGGAGGNGGPAIGIALVGSCTITGTPAFYLGKSGNVGSGGSGGTPVSGSACNGATGLSGNNGKVVNTIQF